MKYVSIPVEIDAIYYTGRNTAEVCDFLDAAAVEHGHVNDIGIVITKKPVPDMQRIVLHTGQGPVAVAPHSYISDTGLRWADIEFERQFRESSDVSA